MALPPSRISNPAPYLLGQRSIGRLRIHRKPHIPPLLACLSALGLADICSLPPLAPTEGLEPSGPRGQRFSGPLRYQLRSKSAYPAFTGYPQAAPAFYFTHRFNAGKSVGHHPEQGLSGGRRWTYWPDLVGLPVLPHVCQLSDLAESCGLEPQTVGLTVRCSTY